MKKEVKEKWAAALRSGKYKQGDARLKQTQNGQIYYCALGVLCDITNPDLLNEKADSNDVYDYILDLIEPYRCSYFWRLNDWEEHNFNQIADYIDKNVNVE